MKKLFLLNVLLITLMSITPLIGFASEPGPGAGEGQRLVGPTLDTVLGVINTPGSTPEEPSIDITFSGICNGKAFGGTVPLYLQVSVADITAAGLPGWHVTVLDFPEILTICNPKPGSEFMIVDVRKFTKSADQVVAEVTIMFIESQ